MSGTTTPPPDDTSAQLLRYLFQGPQQPPPQAPVDRSIVSLLGEAVGGGTTGLSPADREAAGRRALLNFGANLSAASDYSTMPHTFGSVFAQGVGGAQQSLAGSEAVGAARLGAQQAYEEKQQELRINAIKEAIPLLQIEQTERARRALLGGGAPAPGTSIAGVGAPIVPRDPQIETAGKQANNPGNIMLASGAVPTGASGAVPVSGGRYVAAFPDVPTGVAAHSDLLTKYAASGIGTIRDAVTRWVGDPKADLGSYIADVAKAAGVGPDDRVDLADPKIQRAILLAQQPHESGKPWLSALDVDKGLALAAARRAGTAAPAATAPPAPAADTSFGTPYKVASAGTTVPVPGSVQAETSGLVVPPGATPPPGVVPTPPLSRVPDAFVPASVPIPPDVQQRIDHPEKTPGIEETYRSQLSSIVSGPDAGKQMQEAQTTRAAAIAKVRADAIAQAQTIREKGEAQQQEAWKVLRAEQAARETAAARVEAEAKAASLANRTTQINKLRDTAIGEDTAQLKTLRTNADDAEGTIKQLQILRSIEKRMPEQGSAWFRDHPDQLETLVTRFGMSKEALLGADARSEFQKVLRSMALTMSQKASVGAGSARGVEINNNIAALPDLATDHTGRVRLMGFIHNMAQDTVNRANEAEDYYYSHDHPSKELDLHQSLFKFPRYYEEKYPSIIPRAPIGATNKEMADWAAEHVKPGMVYEAPIYKTDPLLGVQRNPRTGKPIVDHWEVQPREDDQ